MIQIVLTWTSTQRLLMTEIASKFPDAPPRRVKPKNNDSGIEHFLLPFGPTSRFPPSHHNSVPFRQNLKQAFCARSLLPSIVVAKLHLRCEHLIIADSLGMKRS